ncbi:MAG TPA: 2Fe-2S iron-sulfur cluster-binding protein, partial [Nitrospira sp.]|nr:2Fe-2S iron-sulfur cluster-binding protein [Nitrospira sp.]
MKDESPSRSVPPSPLLRASDQSVVTLTIDGRRVSAERGDTVFTAARRAGLALPGLCASDHLKPFGSCRLCVCEVEGQKGTPASCTTPVQAGMVVRTQSERVTKLRRNVVELLLSEQPADGTLSPALQEVAQSAGLESIRYRRPAVRADVRDSSNPFFSFDNTICISCARCVRACDEIQGTFALTMFGRGFESRPAAGGYALSAISHQPSARGFDESNCVSCGACVKECPTGALVEKRVLQLGSPTQSVRTTCAYCGVGCAFNAGVRDGQVVTMEPADDGPSNEGHACMKGRFGWTYIDAPDRLTMPL